MSQDFQLDIFNFSNGYERSAEHHHQQQQQHVAQQIQREKLRVKGYEQPPLVGLQEGGSGGLPVYETDGMLSEMFDFPSGSSAAATGQAPAATEWYGSRSQGGMAVGNLEIKNQSNISSHDNMAQAYHHQHQISNINADSAAAMQLFQMNPQPRSPSPHPTDSSSLHMLVHDPSSSLQGLGASAAAGGTFGSSSLIPPLQFTWGHDSSHGGNNTGAAQLNNPTGVVEGQVLSLSLASSLQNLEVAKAEDLRMGDGGLLYYNNQGVGGGGGSSSTTQYSFKNLESHHQQQQLLQLQGGVAHRNHDYFQVGFGTSIGNLRNSKYAKAAQELLEESCSVGRGQFKKNKSMKQNTNPNSNVGSSSSSVKDVPALSAADRTEHQRRKVKLLSMLDEVDKRYNHYCEQLQMVVNSFDMVMGYGASVPYTALAQKAMSRHFRCLKEAIAEQLKHSCELLGEKDASGTSGITKGETPRLRLLEQSLRQQRAFHQMGMMDQEAWRPQRGLPERSVNTLRSWLFEHFLHPYPSDADKHLLARQTGLSRNQVSNWFINARVRLWKPMVEEMYQQEFKEEAEKETTEKNNQDNNNSGSAQTPTPCTTTATTTAPGKRSEINATDSDSSLIAINKQCYSSSCTMPTTTTNIITTGTATTMAMASQCFPASHHVSDLHSSSVLDDTCRRRVSMIAAVADYGTNASIPDKADIGSTLITFGTTPGDVSLTLGLRHAGNMPENTSSFSVRDFGSS